MGWVKNEEEQRLVEAQRELAAVVVRTAEEQAAASQRVAEAAQAVKAARTERARQQRELRRPRDFARMSPSQKGVAGLELLEAILKQLQAASEGRTRSLEVTLDVDQWETARSEAVEASRHGVGEGYRDSLRDEDVRFSSANKVEGKPGLPAALQTLLDAELEGREVLIIGKPELVRAVKQFLGHESSPSVGAPFGAGVGTPTVGAEEGGAAASPADAPPTNSHTAATPGSEA